MALEQLVVIEEMLDYDDDDDGSMSVCCCRCAWFVFKNAVKFRIGQLYLSFSFAERRRKKAIFSHPNLKFATTLLAATIRYLLKKTKKCEHKPIRIKLDWILMQLLLHVAIIRRKKVCQQ